MCNKLKTLAALLLIVAGMPAMAQTIQGRVVGISDGDTLTLLTRMNEQVRVRLDGIDAPEKSQAYGQRSKESLSSKAYGREVLAECHKSDQYGRKICTVMVGGQNVNLSQVRDGMAWWYRHYQREQGSMAAQYQQAETYARQGKLGLWLDDNPQPPWEYRRGQ